MHLLGALKSFILILVCTVVVLCAIFWIGIGDVIRGFIVYKIPVFSIATNTYQPSDDERIDVLNVVATPGEYEACTFSLYALKPLHNISCVVSDLNGHENVISRDNVSIRVVKVWRQAGTSVFVDKPVEVPELLLCDDSVVLQGRRPSVGPSKKVCTSIPKRTSKQFWVTIKIPPDIPPGKYHGRINITLQGKEIKSLRINVSVLSFLLVDPKKDFLIYCNTVLDPEHRRAYETPLDYYKQLKNIKEHGFTGACIYSKKEYLISALILYQIVGFTSNVPYLGGDIEVVDHVAEIDRMVEKNNLSPVLYYGYDEPNNEELVNKCIDLFREIKRRGGKTITAVMKRYGDKIGAFMDVANYSLCDKEIEDYIAGLNNGSVKKSSKKEYYYWQIIKEKPKTHRLMCGFYLWKSKLDGIFPSTYQWMTNEDPYDDFTPLIVSGAKYRPHLVTYPSKEGPIDTLQWEACREGIDDMKYVATLEESIRRLKNRKAVLRLKALGRDVEDPRIKKIDSVIQQGESLLREIDAKIEPDCLKTLEKLTEEDLVGFRDQIVKEIMKVSKELKE